MYTTGRTASKTPAWLINHYELSHILRKTKAEPASQERASIRSKSWQGSSDRPWWGPRIVEDTETVKQSSPRNGYGTTQRRTTPPPVEYALVPSAKLVSKAIAEGRGLKLLAKWDELLSTAPWNALAEQFGAAHAKRPGGALEAHHRAKAVEAGFDVVPKAHARALRERLAAGSVKASKLDMAV